LPEYYNISLNIEAISHRVILCSIADRLTVVNRCVIEAMASFQFIRGMGGNIFVRPIIKLKKTAVKLSYISIVFLSQHK